MKKKMILEKTFGIFKKKDVLFSYETLRISFDQPTQKKSYTPDFPIEKSFIVETKGNFNSADRKKHKLIKAQHPEYDIRFVFSNARTRIGKKSKPTTPDPVVPSTLNTRLTTNLLEDN